MTKKISGKYKDTQEFIHIIFWVNNKWIDELYNPLGRYCSHAEISSKQIRKYISYLMKIE